MGRRNSINNGLVCAKIPKLEKKKKENTCNVTVVGKKCLKTRSRTEYIICVCEQEHNKRGKKGLWYLITKLLTMKWTCRVHTKQKSNKGIKRGLLETKVSQLKPLTESPSVTQRYKSVFFLRCKVNITQLLAKLTLHLITSLLCLRV